jgi:dimethylamine/trimethylamine dehydrogenase
VLVVGGGPAGMECARVLGERGYTVHLREAQAELGGHWRGIATLPRLGEWARVISYRQTQLAKLRKQAEVHLGVGPMTAKDVLDYGADRVIIATGYHWADDGRGSNYGPVPGADASLAHVLTPTQILTGKPVPGRRVLVLDGDGHFMGITLAEMMANQGKQVTYVCDANDISEYGAFTLEAGNNKRMLFEKGIKSYCNHWVDSIEPGRVRLSYLYKFGPDLLGPREDGAVPRRDNGGEFDLEIDAVILVTSRYSEDRLWRDLKARRAEWAAGEIEDVFRVGDCKAPAQLNQALWDAHRLAREFDSPHPAQPLPWIRERQLWGGETVPKLGDPRVDVEAG